MDYAEGFITQKLLGIRSFEAIIQKRHCAHLKEMSGSSQSFQPIVSSSTPGYPNLLEIISVLLESQNVFFTLTLSSAAVARIIFSTNFSLL